MRYKIFDQVDLAREKHKGMLLLFRIGDFYEFFDDDAEVAAKTLDITLTSRSENKEKPISRPMAGFPYHCLEKFLGILLKAGHRVAICEEIK